MRRWWADESGATVVEYALIASIVSISIIGGLTVTRTSLVTILGQVSAAFGR